MDCTWNHPGADPYTGGPEKAIAYYVRSDQLPKETADKLLARMLAVKPDKGVDIYRDSITGGFDPAITSMHFGKGRVCDTVSRSNWTTYEYQPALIYCEDGYCLIEPVICHNISMVQRAKPVAVPLVVAELPTPVDAFDSALVAPLEPPAVGVDPPVESYASFGGWYGMPPPFGYVGGGYIGGSIIYPPAVILSPVPEPVTWALMLGGIVLLGVFSKVRK